MASYLTSHQGHPSMFARPRKPFQLMLVMARPLHSTSHPLTIYPSAPSRHIEPDRTAVYELTRLKPL